MTCPVCGSGGSTAYRRFEFRPAGTQTAYHLEQCSGCGIVFTAPQPDQAMLDRLYADSGYYSYQPFLQPPADAKPDCSPVSGGGPNPWWLIIIIDMVFATRIS